MHSVLVCREDAGSFTFCKITNVHCCITIEMFAIRSRIAFQPKDFNASDAAHRLERKRKPLASVAVLHDRVAVHLEM